MTVAIILSPEEQMQAFEDWIIKNNETFKNKKFGSKRASLERFTVIVADSEKEIEKAKTSKTSHSRSGSRK